MSVEGSAAQFTIRAGILCNASDYFAKALEGRFKEAGENKTC